MSKRKPLYGISLDDEADVYARRGIVVYRMLPEVAVQLSAVLLVEAERINDSGWRRDANLLRSCAEEAEGQS